MKVLKVLILMLMITFGLPVLGQIKTVQDVQGWSEPEPNAIWLSHEHILVDFLGADSIQPERWNVEKVSEHMLPFLLEAKKEGVTYFVDATPNYLARDPELLRELSQKSDLRIITNTGYYGARENKYIPAHAYALSARQLADIWIDEFKHGIGDTGVKPGFIKISVDAQDPLDEMHQKLVEAAAITHLQTGLTIGSHTGKATGLWPQLEILEKSGVDAGAFIWIHAQAEEDFDNYLLAAQKGCWISLDGLGWDTENHLERILFARQNGILNRILISHDAGWYDPAKDHQEVKGYLNIFQVLLPELIKNGFSQKEIDQLLRVNPAEAFAIKIRKNE